MLERFHKLFGGLFGDRGGEEGDEEGADKDDFEERFGWLFNLRRFADDQRVSLEEAEEFPVMQFLNSLVYMKEWEQHEKKMIKRARNNES